MSQSREKQLLAEIEKLRKAVSGLIPFVGMEKYGPAWATEDAKRKNCEMCDTALEFATECLPWNWGSQDFLASNN